MPNPLPAIAALCVLASCGPNAQTKIDTALASPAGQLFCAVQTSGGGAVVVGLVNAEIVGAAPGAAPVAVLATGASKAFVDAACAKAGGIAVSPPPVPAAAPVVAVVPPKVA